GLPTTHLDMDAVESVGLVKMDILAQGGLAVMRDAKESLSKCAITVDLNGLEPWQDPEVWAMIASGGARAVHHIESPAMTSLSKESLSKCAITVDLNGLEPWQDPEVWAMIASGGARAVHHIESPAMTSLC